MYQAATIDTSQISPINVNAQTSLPEVVLDGFGDQPQTLGSLETQASSPPVPVTASAIEVGLPLRSTQEWPNIETMITELQSSGMLNPELGTPLAVSAPVNKAPAESSLSPEPGLITLANTAVNFERPSAEYILHQPDEPPRLAGWMIVTGMGLVVIIGFVVFMYGNLLNQGMTHAEIMQTTLDALQISQ